MVTLTHAGFSLTLNPDHGGTVSSFMWRGKNLLRAAADPRSALASAAFPMVPFCGRVDQGAFTWDGTRHQLALNFLPEPHAIHGFGWQKAWQVEDIAIDTATLLLRHTATTNTDWPWPFEARQCFELTDTGLTLSLSITSLADTPMPAGMGWHPYFPRGDATLEAPVTAVWAADAGGISTGTAGLSGDSDLRGGKTLSKIALDHAFECGTATDGASARLLWPESGICLLMTSTAGLGRLVVYVPPGQDYFCVEPLSHAPDAINRPPPYEVTGLRVLAPGETWEEVVRLELG
jgi:aldose 1-epimerase